MEEMTVTHTGAKPEGNPHRIKILLYHRIVNDERLSQTHWHSVHLREFRRQLEFLDRWGFTPITLNDYRLFTEGKLNLPARPVIITFDDGYSDTYTYAFPLLQEYGMKATVFVLGDRRIKSNYWDSRTGFPEVSLMQERQIVEMREAGFEIGAHSMTHAKLTLIPEDKAWEEISRSRILLEILLNEPVLSFSYPYGALNGMTKRMTEHAGYRIACGVYSGPAVFGKDPFEIRRTSILNNTSLSGFALRLLTPYEYYSWLRWRLSRSFKRPGKQQRQIARILEEKKRKQERHNPHTAIEVNEESITG